MVVIVPILIGILYVAVVSFFREPARRKFNAIMVAGAGAAYLSSGSFKGWEFVFTAVITYCAYRGLDSYTWIGIAWFLHAAWDVLHYLRGAPIIPFAAHSSLGCAICDPVIALWCLRGGPSLPALIRSRLTRRLAIHAAGSTTPGLRVGKRAGQQSAGPEPGGRPMARAHSAVASSISRSRSCFWP